MDAMGWKPVSKIGGGRFSDIYKVSKSDPNTGNGIFALKLVDPDDEKPPHNIRNEIKILSDMKKASEINGNVEIKNVITMISVSFNNIEYGLIFPLYDLTLDQVLKKHIKSKTTFNIDGTMLISKKNTMPIVTVHKLFTGLLKGLDWIHTHGIIHRDINPNNILFSSHDLETPVIIDFGIAYQEPDNNGLEASDKKITDIATGMYKAPELLLSKRDYSNKVDMWAAGILLTVFTSKDGKTIFDQDAIYSDLVLLHSILSTFGSPPSDWSDCKGLPSFDSMNRTFFTKEPKPLKYVAPRLYETENPRDPIAEKLEQVLVGLTKYETNQRFSANDSLNILC